MSKPFSEVLTTKLEFQEMNDIVTGVEERSQRTTQFCRAIITEGKYIESCLKSNIPRMVSVSINILLKMFSKNLNSSITNIARYGVHFFNIPIS